MAEVKISQLPLKATSFAGTEEFAINDGGTTRKTTLDSIYARVGSLSSIVSPLSQTSIVAAINSLYNLDATATQRGLMNTGSQVFAGNKTLNGNLILDGNSVAFKGGVGQYVILRAGTMVSSHTLFLPITSGSAGQALKVDGSAQLYFSNVISSITAGTGLTGGTITTSGTIALATTAVTAGSYGSNIASSVITVDAYGRLTSAATTIIRTASALQSGVLSASDWSAFNSKLSTPTGIPDGSCLIWDSGLSFSYNFTKGDVSDGAGGVEDVINIGHINIGGRIRTSGIRVETGTNVTIDCLDHILFFCADTVGTYTITLPDSADLVSGEHFIIKVCDYKAGATINVVPQGTDRIDTRSSITIDEDFGYIHVVYAEDPAGTGNNQFAILSLK
jgi:hypothetical protein